MPNLIEVPWNKLLPNPYRDIKHYPIQKDKVDALVASMKKTGVWVNIDARPAKGGYEISAGHHRRIAIKKVFGPKVKVWINVLDLSDEQMLLRMIHENSDVYGSDSWMAMEGVEQVIAAYGRGEIELGEVPIKTPEAWIRYVPATQRVHRETAPQGVYPAVKPYTMLMVAQFLGKTIKNKTEANREVTTAFNCLDVVNSGYASKSEFHGVSRYGAMEVNQQARKTEQAAENLAAEELKIAEEKQKQADKERDSKKKSRMKRAAADAFAKAKRVKKEAKAEAEKFTKHCLNELRKEGKEKGTGLTGRAIAGVGQQLRKDIRKASGPKSTKIPNLSEIVDTTVKQVNTFLNRIGGKDDIALGKSKALVEWKLKLSKPQRLRLSKFYLKLSERALDYSKQILKETDNV